MTWNTVDVLGISCTGNTAMKLAWEILNVFAMYRMGFWWVLYPFPCNVLAVYLLGTPALAPSEKITKMAFEACANYGMNDIIGPVSYGGREGARESWMKPFS